MYNLVSEHSRCNYDGEDSSTSTLAGTSSKGELCVHTAITLHMP